MAKDNSSSVPESLLRWPYAARQLLQTPHPALIEEHARNLLSRALNIGRLAAFVGSGASMAYGRISWIDMLYTAQTTVLRRYETNKDKLGETKNHIERLANLIKLHKIERDSKAKASAQLAVFQLAEELDSALDKALPKSTGRTFRETIMWVTRDDRGHAEQLLCDAFLDRDLPNLQIKFAELNKKGPFEKYLPKEDSAQSESIDDATIEKMVRCTLWGSDNKPYKDCFIPHQPEGKRTLNHDLRKELEKEWICACRNIDFEEFLYSPARRYRLPAWLRSLPEKKRFRVLEIFAEALQNARAKTQEQEGKLPRKDITLPHRDPLLILHRDLNVKRFLTTNYDHEIERLFEDSGYHRSLEEIDSDKRRNLDAEDPLAPTYTEILFSRDWTGELAARAISDRSRRRANWVAHLHGRAEVNDNGRIIVTEDDYQWQYARDDDHRISIDDAIKLAFSSQPILFVGIGMEEVDLLRPLREFMSEPTRLGDRLAVALLPGEGSEKDEAAQKIDLLRRYGVYTIHYGWAFMSIDPQSDPGIRWLALLKEVKDKADEVLGQFDNREKTFEDSIKVWYKHGSIGVPSIIKTLRPRSKNFSSFLSSKNKKFSAEFFQKNSEIITLKKPCTLETIPIEELEPSEEKVELENEINAINEVLSFIQDRQKISFSSLDGWLQWRRDARRHQTNLAGAYSAIKTFCLCAALKRQEQEWKKWREDWLRLPIPASTKRDTISEVKGFPAKVVRSRQLKILLRHALDLPSDPQKQENQYKRFYAGAPSQTFNSLMSALQQEKEKPTTLLARRSRRIFLLVARRGVGKGHFFAAFQPPDIQKNRNKARLIKFFKAIGPQDSTWAGAAFFNFSFSLEVASVFDRLASFLWECWSLESPEKKIVHKPNQDSAQKNWDSLQYNRLERLRYILRLYHEHPPTYRILVALNGISIMFDGNGRAKNGQIQRLFELLISNEFANIPIDFLFVCTENAIPQYFRKPSNSAAVTPSSTLGKMLVDLQELQRHNLSEKGKVTLKTRNDDLKLNITATPNGLNPGFVHLLHEARASVLVNAFFPSVALIIAWFYFNKLEENDKSNFLGLDTTEVQKKDQNQYSNFLSLDTAQETRVAFKEFSGADGAGHEEKCLFKIQKIIFPRLMVAFATAFERSRYNLPTKKPSKIIETLKKSCNCTECDTEDKLISKFFSIIENILGAPGTQTRPFKVTSTFGRVADDIDAFTKRIYNAVGRNRFAFTILMAAAYEQIFPLAALSNQPIKRDELNLYGSRCIQFLEDCCRELESQRELRRHEIVIQRVLHSYKVRHESGESLPVFFEAEGAYSPTQLFHLQQQILWHLAVISVPVEAEILTRCHLIQKTLHGYRNEEGRKGQSGKDVQQNSTEQEEQLVRQLLELLEFRCLVYRVKARGKTQAKDVPVRYGVHRLLQRHIFSQMGAHFVEYPEVDQFSLTLYARQPNDIPRLSPRAHGDLRKTVAMLSGYPEDNEAIAHYECVKSEKNGEGAKFLAPMLRAAYGILRSVYSVASVARFDLEHERVENKAGVDGSLFGLGFFEEHRQQIRWLGEQAKELAKDAHLELREQVRKLGRKAKQIAGERTEAQDLCEEMTNLRAQARWLATEARGSQSKSGEKSKETLEELCKSLEESGKEPDPQASPITESAKLRLEMLQWGENAEKMTEVPSGYTPFYAEEIAWLYNECGVLSLVQGRLPDAFALFGLALKALDDIEPEHDRPGPLKALVLLNQAVVDIERGHIERARTTLDRIISSFSAADQEARWIAIGYRGLSHHLAGNFEQADKTYKETVAHLIELKSSRAASIFSRHYADLQRSRDQLSDAKPRVTAAIQLAQEGNHEDVRHLAILSEVKIMIEEGMLEFTYEPHRSQSETSLGNSSVTKPVRTEAIHSRLDMVERYARVMGIPRMMAEVHELRSRLHLRSGDLRTAGAFARKSLEISSLHELQIRKARALVLYAEINLKLGFTQACRPLLKEALATTRDTGYFAAYAQAQDLWHQLEQTENDADSYAG